MSYHIQKFIKNLMPYLYSMNKSITSILILLVLFSNFGAFIVAPEEDTKNLIPEVSLDYATEATPNQELKVTVKVKNTVNDVMWDTLAYIDEDSMTKEAKLLFK